MSRKRYAIAIAGLALLLSAWFAWSTFRCGMMSVEESAPGEPPNEAVCLSAVHPIAIPLVVASVTAIALLVADRAWWTFGIGLVVALGSAPFVFSAGLLGIGVGLLLAGAGLMARTKPS